MQIDSNLPVHNVTSPLLGTFRNTNLVTLVSYLKYSSGFLLFVVYKTNPILAYKVLCDLAAASLSVIFGKAT